MDNFIVQTLVALAVFMAVDLLWLGVIAKNFYASHLGKMMAKPPVWPAAVTFYVLFVVGLVYFALGPAIDEASHELAVKNGALYGFFTYMTYELTNYAVINNWPKKLVVPDIIWGVVLSTLVSYISFVILT